MRLENILKSLIAFPSVSEDTATNAKALHWIRRRVKHLPLTVRQHVHNGYPSLVLTTQKTSSPTLWLQGHVDVVPGSKSAFTPRISGRRLYGRGAFDMKFAVAVYIELLLELGASVSDYNFGVMLTCDEEIGGRNGVRPLLFEDGYRGGMCFLPDGGEDWKFESAAKGIMVVTIESVGLAGHGARPWRGHDANRQLAEYLSRLARAFDKLKSTDPDKKPYPTVTFGIMSGGKTRNQIPDFAEAQIDIRYPKAFGKKKVRSLLTKAKEGGTKIRVREVRNSAAYTNNTASSGHRLFSDITKEILGRRPGTMFSHGSSDARHFRNLKIPVILIRPRGGGQHSEREWIDLPDLKTYYDCVREFVERSAKIT